MINEMPPDGKSHRDGRAGRGEFRFCVGEARSPLSSVWKVVVHGSDIYILSSLPGSDLKASIHESGSCHWVVSAEWFLRRGLQFRNQDRHIVHWTRDSPGPARAAHVFRVLFPGSELKPGPARSPDKKIAWLAPPSQNAALEVEIYLTPASASAPSTASSPYQKLALIKTTSQNWVAVLAHVEPMTASKMRTLSDARDGARRLVTPRMVDRRGLCVIGFVHSYNNPPGLVEFAL